MYMYITLNYYIYTYLALNSFKAGSTVHGLAITLLFKLALNSDIVSLKFIATARKQLTCYTKTKTMPRDARM